jgi:hypothetical protein
MIVFIPRMSLTSNFVETGCRSGEGTESFPNGDKYSGSWNSDLKHGFGTMVYANGARPHFTGESLLAAFPSMGRRTAPTTVSTAPTEAWPT